MLLQKGITGFSDCRNPLQTTENFQLFKTICYTAAAAFNAEIIEISDNQYPQNYFSANILLNGKSICILLNRYYPIIGFTRELHGSKYFIDCKELFSMLSYQYNVIACDRLNAPFDNCPHALDKCELQQIEYYRPTSIGNIIFNEWD